MGRMIFGETFGLGWAIQRAAEVHLGQVDKGGQPYILHPLRVMMAMDTIEEKTVAVLHDVIEDGKMEREEIADDIRIHTSDEVAEAVVALSRTDGESYSKFIKRVKENDLARRVKLADLRDNMDRTRIPNPTEQDEARWRKYEKARKELEES